MNYKINTCSESEKIIIKTNHNAIILLRKWKKSRCWWFAFTSFNIKIINKTKKTSQWTCLQITIYNSIKNCKQVNKNTTTNAPRININKIYKQQLWMKTTMFTFIQITRRRSHERSSSRTFIRQFTLPYKRQGKAD